MEPQLFEQKESTQKLNCSLLATILFVQLMAVITYYFFLKETGYLPTPFFFDKNDTFMDFFHPLFWARFHGRYSEWRSVYPPINFFILKVLYGLIGSGEQYANALSLRASEKNFYLAILATFFIVPTTIVFSDSWKSLGGRQKILIYLIFITSVPFLYCLERGNLIILCLPVIAVMFNRKGLTRAFCLALLVNIKPYFVVLFYIYLIRNLWKECFQAIMLSAAVFFIPGGLIDPESIFIFKNLYSFGTTRHPTLTEVLTMPSSILNLSNILEMDVMKLSRKLNSLPYDLRTLSSSIRFLHLLSLGILAFVVYRTAKLLNDRQIITGILVIICNLSTNVGGYSLILYFAIFPLFLTLKYSRAYLFILCFFSLPTDFIVLMKSRFAMQQSFVSGITIPVNFQIGLGTLLRPVGNFLLCWFLSIEYWRRFCFKSNYEIENTHRASSESNQ